MTALRERRAAWRKEQARDGAPAAITQDESHTPMQWEFQRLGHTSLGDRVLVLSAFARALNNGASPREMRCEKGPKAMNPPLGYWYSSKELAELLHVDASTIRRWRTSHPPQGPAFVRVSNRVYVYNSNDVEAWLASRRVDPGEVA